MEVIISDNKTELGQKAASKGVEEIEKAIEEKGEAYIIVATGASQFEMLSYFVKEDLDWSKVTAFHLDEYIGIPISHPASFRKYLKERFVDKVPVKEFIYINGEGDAEKECRKLQELISKVEIDIAFVGIGENTHLAFNDPLADFETDEAYLVVQLDTDCRKQQMGEGWFKTLEEVPQKAISMSVKQIMKSKIIICSVPDLRKANAVKLTLESDVSPQVPASILKQHSGAFLYLDRDSSSLI